MRKTHRYIFAFVLCVIYGLTVLGPITVPLALRSPVIAHALTGECAGECGLCGCAPERSASHTCCCWQKKLQQAHDDHDDDQEQSDCCKGDKAAPKSKTAGISSRPCGSAKTMALMGVEQSDVLPFRFNQGALVVVETLLIVRIPDCRADWLGEPPDPPPKLSILS
jgi:hypothetical protein